MTVTISFAEDFDKDEEKKRSPDVWVRSDIHRGISVGIYQRFPWKHSGDSQFSISVRKFNRKTLKFYNTRNVTEDELRELVKCIKAALIYDAQHSEPPAHGVRKLIPDEDFVMFDDLEDVEIDDDD